MSSQVRDVISDTAVRVGAGRRAIANNSSNDKIDNPDGKRAHEDIR